eukprot:scaffold169785_cov33-Prasinocladus_malaysianus.AAC.1
MRELRATAPPLQLLSDKTNPIASLNTTTAFPLRGVLQAAEVPSPPQVYSVQRYSGLKVNDDLVRTNSETSCQRGE